MIHTVELELRNSDALIVEIGTREDVEKLGELLQLSVAAPRGVDVFILKTSKGTSCWVGGPKGLVRLPDDLSLMVAMMFAVDSIEEVKAFLSSAESAA